MVTTIKTYVGEEACDYIEVLSELRVEAFKEYPYLYQADLICERNYVTGYTSHKQAMITIVTVDGELAGVSAGIPLNSDSEIVADAKKIFSQKNININDYYYYGEAIGFPKYRKLGLVTSVSKAQDELVKSWGFKHACMLTVMREDDHPLKPLNYKSLDRLWKYLGFIKNNLTLDYHWPTIKKDNQIEYSKNTLEFWTKKIK